MSELLRILNYWSLNYRGSTVYYDSRENVIYQDETFTQIMSNLPEYTAVCNM